MRYPGLLLLIAIGALAPTSSPARLQQAALKAGCPRADSATIAELHRTLADTGWTAPLVRLASDSALTAPLRRVLADTALISQLRRRSSDTAEVAEMRPRVTALEADLARLRQCTKQPAARQPPNDR